MRLNGMRKTYFAALNLKKSNCSAGRACPKAGVSPLVVLCGEREEKVVVACHLFPEFERSAGDRIAGGKL